MARCKAGGKAVQAMEQSHSLMDEFVSEGMSVAMFNWWESTLSYVILTFTEAECVDEFWQHVTKVSLCSAYYSPLHCKAKLRKYLQAMRNSLANYT